MYVGAVTLKALVTELEDVLDWFNFGVHLEVRESDLMIIRHTHLNSRDVKASKTDLFTTWIRTSSLLTWSAVVRALVGIRMEPLAKKLAMKYGKNYYSDLSIIVKQGRSHRSGWSGFNRTTFRGSLVPRLKFTCALILKPIRNCEHVCLYHVSTVKPMAPKTLKASLPSLPDEPHHPKDLAFPNLCFAM